MHTNARSGHRRGAALLIGALLAGAALSASADRPPERYHRGMGTPPSAEEMKAHLQRHLDKMAGRLEIKASQQGAWAAYAQAIEALGPPGHEPPPPDADAATLTRRHADRAAAKAQRLAVVAEATANLSQALDPDQRKTLDQIVREHSMRLHRPHGHPGGMMPPRGGRAAAGPDDAPDDAPGDGPHGGPPRMAGLAPSDD
jgi:LTXXQ motif family protein